MMQVAGEMRECDMQQLIREIETRARAAYARLASGDDLPPGMQLRLEGLLEAAVITGAATTSELQDLLDEAHREVVGETLAARYGDDWRALHPFPELPAWQARAPVSPSTSD
jgi:hypothetical protein